MKYLLLTLILFNCTTNVHHDFRIPAGEKVSEKNIKNICPTIVRDLVNQRVVGAFSQSKVESSQLDLKLQLSGMMEQKGFKKLNDALKNEEFIKLIVEEKVVTTVHQKIAFLNLIHPHNVFELPNGIALSPKKEKLLDELTYRIDRFDFSSGVRSDQVDDFVEKAYLFGRPDRVGFGKLLYFIYDSPKQIIYSWYLHNVYKKGLTSSLELLYSGKSPLREIKFRKKVLKITRFAMISIFSSVAGILDLSNLKRWRSGSIPSDWFDRPFSEIEDDITKHITAYPQAIILKNAISKSLIGIAVGSMAYTIYLNYGIDSDTKNTNYINHQYKMYANEIAYYESFLPDNEKVILDMLDGLTDSKLTSDDTLLENARRIWIERRIDELVKKLSNEELEKMYSNLDNTDS